VHHHLVLSFPVYRALQAIQEEGFYRNCAECIEKRIYQPTFAATRFALMDYKKLSNAMTMLMNNDSKRELLGRRSRSVASRYTWTRFRNEWTILLGIALEDAKNVEISTLKWRSV